MAPNQNDEERLEYDLLMTEEERKAKRKRDANKQEEPTTFGELLSNPLGKRKEKRKVDQIYEDVEYKAYNFTNGISDFISSDDGKTFMFYGAIAIAVIALIIGGIALVRHFQEQKSWKGAISELHYRREKYIEQYMAVGGGDWWDQQPQLSYNNYYASDEIRSYRTEYYTSTCTKTVDDSYTDSKGKRHYDSHTETYSCRKSRQVPVYDRWYKYTINRWGLVKTIFTEERQAKTELTLTAVWPTPDGLIREFGTNNCTAKQLGTSELKIISGPSIVKAEQETDPLLGCQMVANNVGEWYYITYHYEIDKKPFSFECQIDYNTWQPLRVGKEAWGMYYVHNDGFDCNDGHIGIQPTPTKEGS